MSIEGFIETGEGKRDRGYVVRIEPPKEIEALRQDLLRMGADFDKAFTSILQSVATGAKKWVRSRMGSYIRIRTGWLQEHVYAYYRSSSHFVVAAPRHIAEALERGATIKPKASTRKKTLAWSDLGGYVRKHEVTIPPKHWFTRSLNGYDQSAEYQQAVDKGIKKVLKKYNLDDGGTA